MGSPSVIGVLLGVGLWVGAVGMIFDPTLTLLFDKKLWDGGGQLTVCQVVFAHCRPTFAVSQTIFSTSVAVSVVLKFQNLYPPVAYMATIVLFFELFSHSYSYLPEDNMHIAVYSLSFIFVFLVNAYVVYVLWDERIRKTFRFHMYLFCISFAGYWFSIIASDTALGWSKHYYSFFIIEMIGLLAYILVQANLATLI